MASATFARLYALLPLVQLSSLVAALPEPGSPEERHLPFHLHSRATNKDGSTPLYKVATANIEDRVNDLLPRMTVEEKVSQLYVDMLRFPLLELNKVFLVFKET